MDNKLLKAIAKIESNHWQYAMRFEPATYLRKLGFDKTIIQSIINHNKCSRETAAAIYSTSYGEFQLMGFNIYNNNCSVSIGEYLGDKALQEQSVVVYLRQRGLENCTAESLLNDEERNRFAKKYNGPGNYVEYSKKLLESLQTVLREDSSEKNKENATKTS